MHLYGRPNADGTGNFLFDVGMTADDLSLNFSGVDIVTDITTQINESRT